MRQGCVILCKTGAVFSWRGEWLADWAVGRGCGLAVIPEWFKVVTGAGWIVSEKADISGPIYPDQRVGGLAARKL